MTKKTTPIFSTLIAELTALFSAPRSQPAPSARAAHQAMRHPMRHSMRQPARGWLYAFLLPFVLVLTLSASPTPALAANDGTFDCLASNLDWGCRVVNYMFLMAENGVDNNAYYRDGNSVVSDAQGPVEKAFRPMLAFFSNAILIIASLKLLYELIHMTAETAHTGTIGGKGTDTLWAPIRLVIAIGLLVPLSSGLNSGQYIVIQIAKWGSGLATQTWITFTKALNSNQSLPVPTTAQIRDLAVDTLSSEMCMRIANYYTRKSLVFNNATSLSDLLVTAKFQQENKNNTKYVYGNKIYNKICGEIIFKKPSSEFYNSEDIRLAGELTQEHVDLYNKYRTQIATYADQLYTKFLPSYSSAFPSTNDFEVIVSAYQNEVETTFQAKRSLGQRALKEITEKILSSARTDGWTSAGSWFLAITRAQGQIVTGALNTPQSTQPSPLDIKNDIYLQSTYNKYLEWLYKSDRPQDLATNGTSPSTTAVRIKMDNSIPNIVARVASGTGEYVIDALLSFMDWLGYSVGLWSDDPRKAFPDLGSSNNPFGEIMKLGYMKIRLGLNYIGAAMALSVTTNAGSGIVDGLDAQKTFSIAAKFAVGGFAIVATILSIMGVIFLLAGVVLAFGLPLIPFIKFFFAIITWLSTILEAMISIPLFALGHLSPKGEGFVTNNVRNAYFTLFQILLRPVLVLFGMIAALIIFYVGARFLNSTYYEAAGSIGVFDGGMGFIFKVVVSVIYVGVIYITANLSFKLLDQIPQKAMAWMGGGHGETIHDDINTVNTIVASHIGGQVMGRIQSLPGALGDNARKFTQPLGDSMKAKRDAEGKQLEKNQNRAEAQNNSLLTSGRERDAAGNIKYIKQAEVDTHQNEVDTIDSQISTHEDDYRDMELSYNDPSIPAYRKQALRTDMRRKRQDIQTLKEQRQAAISRLENAKMGG